MRQRLGIIITIVLAVAVLIVINSAAYVSDEEKQDSELNPNRSTFNAGATGTRALYDFLSESGYKVMRWREAPEQLLGTSGAKVQTFVVIGTPRVPIDVDEEPPPARAGGIGIADSPPSGSPAPVAHLMAAKTVVLLDYLHGNGRIVLLSDPFIVANGGIGLKDNLRLTLNLLSASNGLIAFDEFHQGRAVTRNAFVNYFAGTPVLAICGQLVLLILLVLWTRGRRFARPLPLPHVDRRSSLEFVASMAELQQRAGAFDLAIENIYSRTRRVLARY